MKKAIHHEEYEEQLVTPLRAPPPHAWRGWIAISAMRPFTMCADSASSPGERRDSAIGSGMPIAPRILMLLHASPIVETIIGCAIEVHRNLGAGLLESAYSPALTYEWQNAGLDFLSEVAVPVEYKGLHLSCGYRVDFVVAGLIVVETKSMDKLLPIHQAQMLTYLKLLKLKQGLLINFNVPVLKDGIRSVLN
jgi:GxxExxY protein